MKLAIRIWLGAILLSASTLPARRAGGADWKAEHDAGWKAYKEGRLDEAERRLKVAEKEARAAGDDDPKLAATLDHLAWVLCSEGRVPEAEVFAKSALAIREKAHGGTGPEMVESLNTLACIHDAAGWAARARRSRRMSTSPAKTSGGRVAILSDAAPTASASGHSGCCLMGRVRQ